MDRPFVWTTPDGKTLCIRRLRSDELNAAYELCRVHLPAQMAPREFARAVMEHNRDSIWGVYDLADDHETLVGFLSFLMLNEDGAGQLKAGRLDVLAPETRLLAPSGERPVAIYVWLIVAPGVAGMAVVLTTQALGSSYGGLPFYGTAATAAGARSFRNFGYEPVHPGRPDVGNLFVLRRTPPSETSAEDKADASSPATKNAAEIRIVVAHSSLEIEHARAIRAAVFIAEQDCPFAEEFDGNDFSATHLVGYVNGEPAATLRIRYFGDGARIERLAVLRRFRKQAVANEIATAAIGFLSRKGIRMAYGNPQLRVLAFWERYGFRRIDGIEPFAFSDHEYVTVGGPLPEHPDPITVNSDPLLILRPEGDWDGPGVLDFSAARPATNPHAEGS